MQEFNHGSVKKDQSISPFQKHQIEKKSYFQFPAYRQDFFGKPMVKVAANHFSLSLFFMPLSFQFNAQSVLQ